MKFGEIRNSLIGKGFEQSEGGNHEKYYFYDRFGRRTSVFTVLSRRRAGKDVAIGLQNQIARQLKISRAQFIEFVDCSLTQESYEQHLDE